MDAQAQTVLITGASSGFGKAAAELLQGQGYRVFAGLRSPEKSTLAPGIEVLRLDVRDANSVEQCAAAVLAKAGRIDALVNNAGLFLSGAVEETEVEQAQALFDTNFFGLFRMTRSVLPAMRRQGYGRIVNISSILGFLPGPYAAMYTASKHAVEGLSESLDHEVRNFGIRVVVIEPGFFRTSIDANAMRAAHPVEAYAETVRRITEAIGAQVAKAPGPEPVARAIAQAVRAPGFRRVPVGPQAGTLRALRRWLPARMLDSGLRKTFQLA